MNRNLHNAMISQYATPKVSGDGLVSWDKGVKCVLPSVKLYGAAVQEGTPTPDAPIMPVCNDGVFVGVGRNLFDIRSYPLTQGRYLNGNNGNLSPSSNYSATFGYVPCIPGTTITLNKRPGGMNPGFCFYTSDFVFISGVVNNGAEAGTPWTIAVPNEAYYMRFTVPIGETDIQVELGDTATPYTPYWDGGTAQAPELWAIPGTEYMDEWNAQTGKGIRRVKVLHLKDVSPSKITNGIFYFPGVSNSKYMTVIPICTHYQGTNKWYKSLGESEMSLNGGNGTAIFVRDSRFSTVEDLKAWLDEADPVAYSPCVNPEPFHHPSARLTQPNGPGQIIQFSGSVSECPIEVNYLTHAGGAST